MELKVAIYYRNAYAHYKITRENKGVYYAELLTYDGRPQDSPAASITLIRGIHRWWGSKDGELLHLLGDSILSLTDSGHCFADKEISKKDTSKDTSKDATLDEVS